MENMSAAKRLLRSKLFSLAAVTAVVVLIFYLIRRSYLGVDNIRGILNSMSLSGTIGVGMACLLIGGGVDLAAGAEGCFGGVMVALLISKAGAPWPVALVAVILIGAAIGAFNAFLINVLNFMGFIATIGVSSMLQGIINIITKARNISISDRGFWSIGTVAVANLFTLPFMIMAALVVVYGIILSRTRFGRTVYMCGGNRRAARLSGLNPKKISTILYINCGALASLGGAILAARMHSGSPKAVLGSELDAITAAVLGGVSFMGGAGNMGGCFIGLLLLCSFNNGLISVKLASYWTIVAQGVLLIAALIADYFNVRARARELKAAGA
ncbi:MAG: ABC transporter permease [Oscillospiraceae bacterium]|jgi:ribose/xylose/arabinose/galactoside ABC-type transport system permease subunit|nr:ABC transporter permease [Oscillospiraceae bacterium]